MSLYTQWMSLKIWWLGYHKRSLFYLTGFITLISGVTLLINDMAKTEHTNRELICLAQNIYHEARGEPKAGQYAVAEVTLNRVSSTHYPETVCGVVYERNWDRIRKRYVSAFSWTEQDLDSPPNRQAWQQAWQVAKKVYFDANRPRLKGALFYHSVHIRPRWAKRKVVVARIGQHIFYK